MNIILIICACITVIYIIVSSIVGHKIPESISETSYIWEQYCKDDKQFHIAYVFSIYCFLIAGLLFYPWLMGTPETWQFLSFLGCAGFMFAGSTPFFKKDFESYIHHIGGITSFICWIVWMIIMAYWTPLIIAGIVFIILLCIKYKSYVLWGELIAIFGLIIMLLL